MAPQVHTNSPLFFIALRLRVHLWISLVSLFFLSTITCLLLVYRSTRVSMSTFRRQTVASYDRVKKISLPWTSAGIASSWLSVRVHLRHGEPTEKSAMHHASSTFPRPCLHIRTPPSASASWPCTSMPVSFLDMLVYRLCFPRGSLRLPSETRRRGSVHVDLVLSFSVSFSRYLSAAACPFLCIW